MVTIKSSILLFLMVSSMSFSQVFVDEDVPGNEFIDQHYEEPQEPEEDLYPWYDTIEPDPIINDEDSYMEA